MDGVFGVIAEFNPFHNGHAALLRAVREQYGPESGVVAVMSGNFVQRGEAAITDKRVRAQAALACGCDLVLELPVAHAAATAQRFALGAVGLLRACGCVDALAFGSECGSAAALGELAVLLDSPLLPGALRAGLDAGMTFARARARALSEIAGSGAEAMISAPNNLLAVEYLRAAASLGWKPDVFTLRRVGVSHDSPVAEGNIASASHLRHHGGDMAFLSGYVPPEAARIYRAAAERGLYPLDGRGLEDMMLSHLRRLTREDLRRLPDLSEGLEDRLYAAIRGGGSLREIRERAKTKRYTMARVRRLLLCAFLGITEADVHAPPPYLRVLGMGARGKEILRRMAGHAGLPVDTSLARLARHSPACRRAAELEALATDLYGAALPKTPPCGYEYSASAVFPGKSGV